jgi:integrase
MTTRGLAPGTVRTRVNNVRAVLRAAVRDRVIAYDPSDSVTLPRLRRTEAALTLPTNDQVTAILAAADDRFRALVAPAAFAGLRLGETAGLQGGDVDYRRRVLLVRRQVQPASGRSTCRTSCSSC